MASIAATEGTPSILADDKKPGDAPAVAAAKPDVPETYEFKPPEIDDKPAEVDTGALDALRGVAKDAGLTQAQFQAIGEHGAKIIGERMAALQDAGMQAGVSAFNDMITEWGAKTKADPEIGGNKFAATLANVATAIDTLGSPDLRKVMVDTGAGNHPEVIRFLARVGAAIGDPSKLSVGKPAKRDTSTNPEERARDFYNAAGGNYPAMTG